MNGTQWHDGKVDMVDLLKRLEVSHDSAAQLESPQSVPHYHVALYVDGKLTDGCAKCGLDLRNPIHRRKE